MSREDEIRERWAKAEDGEPLGGEKKARFPCDSRDGHDLVLYGDNQGDVYVSLVPEGQKVSFQSVRVCGGGGGSSVPGLSVLLRKAISLINTPAHERHVAEERDGHAPDDIAWLLGELKRVTAERDKARADHALTHALAVEAAEIGQRAPLENK